MKPTEKIPCHLALLFCGLLMAGCKKEPIPGTVLVTVKSKNEYVAGVQVYMNKGSLRDPGKPFTEFLSKENTGSSGISVFEGLQPDNYYVFAIAVGENDTLKGSTSVNIPESFTTNRRELLVQVQ
jgi:hypothetical protein